MSYFTGSITYAQRNVVGVYSESVTVRATDEVGARQLLEAYGAARGQVSKIGSIREGF